MRVAPNVSENIAFLFSTTRVKIKHWNGYLKLVQYQANYGENCVNSLNEDKMNAIRAELMLDFDLICLTETNLPYAKPTDLSIHGFHPIIRKDRIGKTGGGVGLYAAEHLSITRKFEYEQ